MAQIGTLTVQRAAGLLRAPSGLQAGVAAIGLANSVILPLLEFAQIITHNVAADVIEKSAGVKYPAFHIYCEKLQNTLREKFRQFSGTASLCVDVRVTHDRMEGLDQKLDWYVDALTEVLDTNRGDWDGGLFYTGGYTVTYQPVKHGGKNFIQTAKVSFDVQVSV
jgi:hypothetical protein